MMSEKLGLGEIVHFAGMQRDIGKYLKQLIFLYILLFAKRYLVFHWLRQCLMEYLVLQMK